MTRFLPADPLPEDSNLGNPPEGEAGGDRPEEIAAGFPRHLTRNLLQNSLDSGSSVGERRRHAFQIALFVLALALFALAQPHLRWMGRNLAWREWRFSNFPAGLVHSSGRLQMMELAEFLASALFAAASVPVFIRMGKACGLSFGRALATAMIGVLAPAAFTAARIAGPEARGLFASALLFLLLLRIGEPSRRRILITSLVAFILDPATLALAPAVLAAAGWKRAPWLLVLLVPALFFGTPAALFPSPEWPPFLALHGLTGLGILLPLLVAPFLASRSELEEPPPSWMALWIAGAALSPFEGAPLLLAPALFGLQDWVGRHQEAAVAPTLQRALVPLLLLQGLCAIGLDSWLRGTDPGEPWRQSARDVLQPHDDIVTDSARSLYLLTVRASDDYSVYWLPKEATEADRLRLLERATKNGANPVLDLSEERIGSLRDALPGLLPEESRRLRR